MILNDLNLCIVDIETTGARSLGHRIIEIAVLKIVNGKQIDQFHSFINPQQPIPSSITELTGITDKDVQDAPIFEDIHRHLRQFFEGCIFVAHNVTFDYGFIRQEFERLGVSFNVERFCSVKLSRTLFSNQSKHDLSSIVERYHIPLKSRHRALDDALGVWEFLKVIQKEISADQQHFGLSKVLRSTKLLPHELPINIDHLPHALGVYLFYDAYDRLLYVGKANDIRSKVWDQIMNNPKFFIKSECQVQRAGYIETQGKLGASLLEAYLVKKYQPAFNRKFKALNQMTTLSVIEDHRGYKNVVVHTHKIIQKDNLKNAYTVFRTKKHALKFLEGIAQKYHLSKAFLGLEKASREDSLEKPVSHNMRLIEALSKHQKINWPFEGPVIMEESNVLKTKGEAFIVDQWIIQEGIKYQSDAEDSLFEADGHFDFDIYRILFNYFNRNKIKILPLTHHDSRTRSIE